MEQGQTTATIKAAPTEAAIATAVDNLIDRIQASRSKAASFNSGTVRDYYILGSLQAQLELFVASVAGFDAADRVHKALGGEK